MSKRYYFDTSIWLDLIENRNEPNFPKGDYIHSLMKKIIKNEDVIVYSDVNLDEIRKLGYFEDEFIEIVQTLRHLMIFTELTRKQFKKSKDLCLKRKIPQGDAIHALIGRDNNAILLTYDKHFQKIKDITIPMKPQDFI